MRRTFLKSVFGAALALPVATQGAATSTRKPLVLQQSPIAGFQYHDGESVWDQVSLGDELYPIREPDNPRDPRTSRSTGTTSSSVTSRALTTAPFPSFSTAAGR